MPSPRHALLASLLVAAALAGCGGASSDGAAPGATTDVALDPAPPAGDEAPADDAIAAGDDGDGEAMPPTLALGVDHLDPLARGIAAESGRIEDAIERLQAARDDRDTLEALSLIDAERLDAIGADAAGLPAHEYRFLRDALYEHLGGVETRQGMQAQYDQLDIEGMDEATATETRRAADEVMAALPDPYAGLAPALAEALRQRHDELAALRRHHIALLFKAVDGA